jgi:aldehyde:ferredoxin oxidoreductase
MALGAGLGSDGFDAIATLGSVYDRLGLDVVSAGNAVAWTMRASEEELLDEALLEEAIQTDLSFGDADAARALIRAVATRDGELAAAVANGVDAAAAAFGGDDLVPTVKSMELPAYDPRGATAMALAYATSDRGACHRRARPVEQEPTDHSLAQTVRTVVGEQTVRSVLWSLIVDDFVGETMWEDLGSEFLAAIDRPYTPAELAVLGERIWTLTRLFNVREGFDRRDLGRRDHGGADQGKGEDKEQPLVVTGPGGSATDSHAL